MEPILLVVIMIVLFFITFFSRKTIGNKRLYHALILLQKGRYQEAESLVTNIGAKLLLSTFSILQVLLQSAILQNKHEQVVSVLQNLSKLKLNSVQKKSVYLEGFNYFSPLKDQKNAKKCMNALKSLDNNEETKKTVQMIYEIVIEKKTDKLDEVLNRANTLIGHEQMIAEYLVSKIYESIGEKEKATVFLQRAQEHFKQYAYNS